MADARQSADWARTALVCTVAAQAMGGNRKATPAMFNLYERSKRKPETFGGLAEMRTAFQQFNGKRRNP